MKALIQRVTQAQVTVAGDVVGAIGAGLLALIGVEKDDNEERAARMLDKLLSYRVFADDQQRMNRNLVESAGGLLLVSQFTLVADTSRGLRPSFSSAAAPEQARNLYEWLLDAARARHQCVAAGVFGADMQVQLTNDGPVTFLLQT